MALIGPRPLFPQYLPLYSPERARPLIVERYEQHKVWAALLEEYRMLEGERLFFDY